MSKVRFLKTTTNYQNYVDAFFTKHPELAELSYEQAQQAYFDDCNAWANYWKINLERTGQFECAEIIENAEMLQKKWAQENGFVYSNDNWQKDILLEQIKSFKPDVLFINEQYQSNWLSQNIKKLVPSIKLIVGWDGIVWHNLDTYSHTDIVLSCVPETVDFYQNNGKEAYYYKFGFEKSILPKLQKEAQQHLVTFAGSLYLAKNFHLGRLSLIADVSRKVDMSIYASSLPQNWNMFTYAKLKHIIRRGDLKFTMDLHRVGALNKGEVFGMDMFNVLYNSKMVFNTHGDNSPKLAANMRMTEATGVGSCLITDWKENLHELFKIDEEVVAYKSAGEAIDKIKNLMRDETLRKKIAEAGQRRTLKEYSYELRMEAFGNYLLSKI